MSAAQASASRSSSSRIVIDIAPTADVNPFPGLRPFEPDEDYLFFGRERQTDDLLKKLRTTRFLSILGRSGSGKSSLVRSGLIPSLHGGAMTRAGSRWRVVIMRPGEDPLGNLAAAFSTSEAFGGRAAEGGLTRAFFETTLHASRLGLLQCIRESDVSAADNVLILVDQFEEIFRYKHSRRTSSAGEAAAFVKLLLAARESDMPVYVAMTMRSDFIGDCMEFDTLPEVVNEGIYLVPRMTREELRSAVTGPVIVGGGTIAPRLVSRLLNDVGDDPDQLPILQHALMRTWERWQFDHGRGEPLDLRHYEAIGTMREALSRHAEEAFGELDAHGQWIAERLFKALTDKASDPRGVRRPAPVSEICAVAQASLLEVRRVAESFRGAGRSFLTPPAGVELEESSILDISHESLMRVWERLWRWADDEADAGQLYLNLAQAAQRHEEGRAALWRDPELQFALAWREKEQPTEAWAGRYDPSFARAMAFLDASRDERDRNAREQEQRRRRALRQARVVIAVLSVAFLGMLWLGYETLQQKIATEFALRDAQNAERQAKLERDRVLVARQRAENAQQRAESEKRRAENERSNAVTERLRADAQRSEAQKQSAIAEAARNDALQNEQKALSATREATSKSIEAENARLEAVKQESAATSAARETRRLSRLAASRALALISRDTPAVNAGLVLEAYRLNRENGGDPDDPELFAALHDAGAKHGQNTVQKLPQPNGALSIAVSRDGRTLFAGNESGEILRHDFDRGRWLPPSVVGRVAGPVRALALRDNLLAAGTDGGRVAIWNLGNAGAPPRELTAGSAPVMSVAFQPGGALLAAGSLDGAVTLFDTMNPRPPVTLRRGQAKNGVRAVAFSPDGKSLAAGQSDGAALWDLTRPKPEPRPVCEGALDVRSLAFRPDGSLLLCGTANGRIAGWPMAAGARLTFLALASVNALSFSPRGDVFASGSADGIVRLWHIDRPDARPEAVPRHEGWIWAVAFNGDGSAVISGGREPSLHVSDARTDVLASHLCRAGVPWLTKTTWDRYVADESYRETSPCADPRLGLK